MLPKEQKELNNLVLLIYFLTFILSCQSKSDMDKLLLSDELFLSGKVDSSYIILKEIEENTNNDSIYIIVQKKIGDIFFFKRMHQEALEKYNSIYSFENFIDIDGKIGFCQFEIGECDSAKFYLKKSIYNNYKIGYCNFLIGKCFENTHQIDSAKFYYKKSIADTSFYLPYNNLGMIFYANNQIDSASEYIDKAILLDPYFSDLYFNKSLLLLTQRKYKEALLTINTALKINNMDAKLYYLKGETFVWLNENDSACVYFEKSYDMGYKSSKDRLDIICK